VIHNLNYAKSFVVEDRTRGGFTLDMKNLMQQALDTYNDFDLFFYMENRDLKLIVVRDSNKNAITQFDNTNNVMITSIEYLSSIPLSKEDYENALAVVFDNMDSLAKVKPFITPRRLAAFEKAGRNVNRIVSRDHQNVRLG
jgi:ATP-dependent Lon protease